MGLADDLLAPVPTQGGGACHVAAVLAQLDADDPEAAEALRTVIALPMTVMPATVIERRLADAGYDLGKTSVQRHRRKDCKCPT